MRGLFYCLKILLLLLPLGLPARDFPRHDHSNGFPPYIQLYGGVNYTILRSADMKSISPRCSYEIGLIARKNTDNFHRFTMYYGLDISRHNSYADCDYWAGHFYGRKTVILYYDSWQVGIPLEVQFMGKQNSRLQFGLGVLGCFAFKGQSYWLYNVYSQPNIIDPATMTVVQGPLTIYLESGDFAWTGGFFSAIADVTFFGGKIAGHPIGINAHYAFGLSEVTSTPHLIQSSASVRLHFVI